MPLINLSGSQHRTQYFQNILGELNIYQTEKFIS